ncbi:MAG: class II aldolase/adducin family protein [Phycisphaeraceae bacterium]|nr:class II aldolase/adducin family protein [Phycisphaeraceae bacterium]
MNGYTDQPIWQLKKQMCDIGQRIWQKGFCAGNEGNHSARIGPDRVLCTPTGVSKGFLTPEDICVVDMNGKQVEPNAKGMKRTSEVLIHLAIYKHRPDIRAVIHSHPPHATAFAIAQIPLPAGIHPEAEVFLGKVPTARYATPSKPDLADSIIPLIKPDTNTVLMGNHGSVSFDATLIGAYYRLEILDAYSRILLLCKQLGNVNVLSKDEMVDLLKVKESFGFPDSRLTCAASGCVVEQNQPFLASFDVRPMSAACACGSDEVTGRSTPLDAAVQTAVAAHAGSGPVSEETFEQMVAAITDQIMAAKA